MKKYLILAAIAGAALVSCTKTQQISSIEISDNPIAFQAYNALKTKAMIEGSQYTPDCPTFMAKAYYLGEGKTWNADSLSATMYMPEEKVSWQDSVWITSTLYYWPKDNGSLTFMAYTPASISDYVTFNVEAKDGVEISKTYNIEEHQDVDFMVADIVRDATASNTNSVYTYTGGSYGKAVQALFRHKLSQISGITVKTEEDYESLTINVGEIVIIGHYTEGTYEDGVWVPSGERADSTYLHNGDLIIGSSESDAMDSDYYLMIPQDADEVVIVITYEVTSGDTTYEVTVEVPIKTYQEAFEEGTKYSYDFIIGKDENGGFTAIKWAPEIVEWAEDDNLNN